MISYAQNYEDVMLRRVFRDRQSGFYIDVGAMDPVEDSVTNFFYGEGWSGINIEPNEFFYNRLLAERPRDINLKLAIGEREEARPLHVFEQVGNSTFDLSSRDSFAAGGYESHEEVVRVTTLAAVCRDYVRQEIDILKIDCEGWEKNALEGADWDRFRPTVLVVEATEPGTTIPAWDKWEPILLENERYEMVYFDGLNRYYLRREYRDLRVHFETPPNIFDGFTPYRAAKAEQRCAVLQAEQQNAAAQIARLEEEAAASASQCSEQAVLLNAHESGLKRTEEEMEGVRRELGTRDEALAALVQERDGLTQRLLETQAAAQGERQERERQWLQERQQLETQAASAAKQVEELERVREQLEAHSAAVAETLLKTRLWVGQLAQDSASKVAR